MEKKLYKRLIAQAEEARELGLTKLADELESALSKQVSENPDVEIEEEPAEGVRYVENFRVEQAKKPFDKDALRKRSRDAIWDVTFAVLHFYKLNGADAASMEKFIDAWGDELLSNIESVMKSVDAEAAKAMKEQPVPGQKQKK